MGNKIADSALTKKYSTIGLVTAMLLMFSWTGMGWNALGTYSVFVVETFGCSTAQFMTNFTILSTVNMIISFTFYGFTMERFGTRNMITIGGVILSIGFVLFGMAKSIQFMWFAAFVFAVGLAYININTYNVMITKWFKKNTAKYTGIGQAFGPASGALFNTIWGVVILSIGWRIPFYISAVISAAATIIIFALYRDPEEIGCKAKGEAELEAEMAAEAGNTEEVISIETGDSFAESLKNPRAWLITLGYVLAGICDYGLLGNYALIAADHGYGDQAGFIMGFCWLAQVFSFIVLGWICDKWGSRWAVSLCFVLVVLVAIVYLRADVPAVAVYACGACLGFADGAVQMPMGATAREVLGTKDFAKKMGLVGGGCFLGVSFSTVIVARIFDVTGSYNPAFIMIIILAVVTTIIFLTAGKTQYKIR